MNPLRLKNFCTDILEIEDPEFVDWVVENTPKKGISQIKWYTGMALMAPRKGHHLINVTGV